MVLTEQIRAIDKRRLRNYVGRLKAKDMLAVGQALRYSLGLCLCPVTNTKEGGDFHAIEKESGRSL